MLERLGLLWLLAAPAAHAAYVQWQPCKEMGDMKPVTLSAALHENHGSHLLTLTTGHYVEAGHCQKWSHRISAEVSVDMLAASSVHQVPLGKADASCRLANYTVVPDPPTQLSVNFTQDIGRLYPISTFGTIVHLRPEGSRAVGCLQAQITPDIGFATSAVLRSLSMVILFTVLVVGTLRTVYDRPVELPSDHSIRPARPYRPILPAVGDCLNYLQFIFLTGCLSLRYPGFYQPIASQFNWFSLFITGPVTHGHVYPSISDGIYEINGTYGGTFGFELMHQIVGAPMTMDTWLNMVITILLLVVGVALLLEVLRCWNPRSSHDIQSEIPPPTAAGWSSRLARVLRVIFSYFTMPLAALTFYQTNTAEYLPTYHTTFSMVLISIILVAFIWLLWSISGRHLGLLVLEKGKRYHRIPREGDSADPDRIFVLVVFILCFIRGAAIGGLQVNAPAQLAVLGGCEFVLLACIFGLGTYPIKSIVAASAAIRLTIIILMVPFLPDLAPLQVKSAIGYVILAIHCSLLLFGFVVPAVWQLWVIFVWLWNKPKPEAYGLRQLRRRSVSQTPLQANDENATSSSQSPTLQPFRPTRSTPTLRLETPRSSDHYFRHPRTPSTYSMRSADQRWPSAGSSGTAAHAASIAPLRPVSPVAKTHSPSSSDDSTKQPLRRVSESSSDRRSSEQGSSPPGSSYSRPTRRLGPKWEDYSFREADLYFEARKPPRLKPGLEINDGIAESQPIRSPMRLVSSGARKLLSGKGDAPEEKGFQVIRRGGPAASDPS